MICLNRKDGSILWEKKIKSEGPEDTFSGYISEHGYASSTPVTDGKAIYCFFGKAGVYAFNLEGRPDFAILPIGDLYTMGPFQAAHAVRLLGVQHVLGSHWGTFDALTGTPDQLKAELAALGLGDVAVHELAPGDSL